MISVLCPAQCAGPVPAPYTQLSLQPVPLLGLHVRVTAEVVERLAGAAPRDLAEVELPSYRGLVAPWTRWEHVVDRGRHFARVLLRDLLGGADS